jgi:hypothetical protein
MYRLRSRVINFRVTDEELERLKTASELQGARCLSDFARSVILSTTNLAAVAAAPNPDERLRSIEERLSSVESSLARIKGALLNSNPVVSEG